MTPGAPEETSPTRMAFRAGYAPQVAGLYFNGLELLAEASRTADVGLAALIDEERERVDRRREEAQAEVSQAGALVAALGSIPVTPPEDAEAHPQWAEAVFDAVRAVLDPQSPEAVAHLLGYVLGESVATLDVIAILCRLREREPDNLWMRLQGDSLERERRTAERRLAKLAGHPLVPGPAQVAVALAAHAVADAAPTGTYGGQASRADEACAQVREQAAVVARQL